MLRCTSTCVPLLHYAQAAPVALPSCSHPAPPPLVCPACHQLIRIVIIIFLAILPFAIVGDLGWCATPLPPLWSRPLWSRPL